MTRFVLYRILGNDLPPRHRAGQTLDNLRFILDHEPPLPGCEKRWVVNRIVDRAVERTAIRLIRAAGHSFIHIPFDLAAYARRSFRWDHLPPERYFHRAGFRRLPWLERSKLVAACLADRNGYAMNNNGARNAALREGRLEADWVLPWDGGCFIAAAAWQAIVDSARDRSARYLVVPLARIERNAALLDPDFAPRAAEEPQIAFGPGSVESFDETVPYGGSPKGSLLVRLGVPGVWHQWPSAIEAAQRLGASPDAGHYRTVGWTARLQSGNAEAEANADTRHRHRLQATISFISRLDAATLRRARSSGGTLLYDTRAVDLLTERSAAGDSGAAALIAAVRAAAGRCMEDPIASVADKTAAPASGDRRDYWSVAPHWWPAAGGPVRRDGERVPVTEAMADGDRDRARLQVTARRAITLALAARLGGEPAIARRAAALVRAWLIDPSRRMNPNLRFAQTILGGGSEGTPSAVVEGRHLVHLLDAATLLGSTGALDAEELRLVRDWAGELLDWLRSSVQGQAARRARNNIGTYHDLLLLALSAHVGAYVPLAQLLDRLPMRMVQQMAPDGSQPQEAARTRQLHYALFNLEAWASIVRIADRFGRDLRPPSVLGARSLRAAAARAGESISRAEGPAGETDGYRRRLHAIRSILRLGTEDGEPAALPDAYDPAAGLPPFWMVGLRTAD